MDAWVGDAFRLMKLNRIKQKEIADRIGVRGDYLNALLNGRKKTKTAREKIMAAISEIIAERNRS